MVYESDFYTTRRPYRASPSLSTYTVTSEPSRQVRILPGLGKVHVVHSYDRIIPYIGHKRLTVVTQPPTLTVRVRPSTLYREFDRIEHKLRPYTYNSYINDYLNSDSHVRIVYVRNPITGSLPVYRPSTLYTSRYYGPYGYSYASRVYYPSYLNTSYYTSYLPALYTPLRSYYYYPSERWWDLALYPSWRYSHYARMFDDETRAIRAQINSLTSRVHTHVPRKLRPLPLPYTTTILRHDELPARWSNDNYIHRMVCSSPSNTAEYITYWSDPVRRQFWNGRLACVSIVGGKGHPRRKNIYVYQDDPVRNDIQLLSYYINRFREERSAKKPISVRVPRPLEDAHMDTEEMVQMKKERADRLARLSEIDDDVPQVDVRAKLAEERAQREATLPGAARKAAAKKREEEEAAQKEAAAAAKKKAAEEAEQAAALEAARRRAAEEEAAEVAAQKEREAQEAAAKAKAAELERLAELARQEERAKQAEIEKARREEEERARLEEEKRQAEAARAEEERQQLLRLEEIARQAEEEREAELARQAEELAELARQEAELAELAKTEAAAAEEQRRANEAAELAQKEAELAELESREKELTEQAEAARAEAEGAAGEEAESADAAEEGADEHASDVVSEAAPEQETVVEVEEENEEKEEVEEQEEKGVEDVVEEPTSPAEEA